MKILFIIIFERFDGLVLPGLLPYEPCQSGNTAAISLERECWQIAKSSKEIIDNGFGFARRREVTMSFRA